MDRRDFIKLLSLSPIAVPAIAHTRDVPRSPDLTIEYLRMGVRKHALTRDQVRAVISNLPEIDSWEL